MSFVTTTYAKGKPFAWSYSKLKNFRTCPKRHYHYEVARDVVEPEGEALKWGNSVHEAFAKHVANGKPLPDTMAAYQPVLDRIKGFPGETFVEQKYAITKDFAPTEYFARDVWFRGVGDVVKLHGAFGYAGDYKTGKVVEDSEQLGLLAACLFAHYPQLLAVQTEFIWLAEDAVTRAVFKRDGMAAFWAGVLPDVKRLQHAHANGEFPPRPGFLCRKWCAVKTCIHHGGS